MQLAVIGTGYVGLVAGAGFADFGNHVTCVDIDAQRIDELRAGRIPIYEPRLEELVRQNVEHERLFFTTDISEAVKGAEVVFIAVGTPPGEDGSADLQYVLAAAEDIGKNLTGPATVVTKSTVPVGTGDKVRAAIKKVTKHEVWVASNPEFLKEGDAVNDFMKPDRIIIGSDDEGAIKVLRRLYAPFVRTSDRVQVMDQRSAELAKYAANAMLATRISFMNELSILAEAVDADIESVRRGLGSDPRIGNKFLFAGAGFGGSCFPKDIRALGQTAKEVGVELGVLDAVERANERQKKVLFRKISARLGENLGGKRIALWGLAFKPKTDDVREAPALVLARELVAAGAKVIGYDPEAMETAKVELGDSIEYARGMYQAAEGVDALVLVTEWHPFRRPNFKRLKDLMEQPLLFDGRNVWSVEEVRDLGFEYFGIGRRA
jgi:UDPglucose 6-dehydrogenase